MKRHVLFIIFSCITLYGFSQEKIVIDTIPKPLSNKPELLIELPLIQDNSLINSRFEFYNSTIFNQPLIPDYNGILGLKRSLSSNKPLGNTDLDFKFAYSPFFSSGKIFNQASYHINDKFLFGGNSFGMQSVFDRLTLNPAIQNMSTKGASMYMQYKVSKNFRIETRVSVTNH